MKNRIFIFSCYVAVAVLGSLSAYILVHQFIPTAHSQTEDLLEPALEAPEEYEDLEPAEISEFPQEGDDQDGAEIDDLSGDSSQDSVLGSLDSLISDGYHYDPAGKRNPFSPFVRSGSERVGPEQKINLTDLQRFDLTEILLVGIIWNVDNPKAMLITPDKKVHTVGMNHKVGRNNGYIAVIREDELIVIESFEEGGEIQYNTRVLSMVN